VDLWGCEVLHKVFKRTLANPVDLVATVEASIQAFSLRDFPTIDIEAFLVQMKSILGPLISRAPDQYKARHFSRKLSKAIWTDDVWMETHVPTSVHLQLLAAAEKMRHKILSYDDTLALLEPIEEEYITQVGSPEGWAPMANKPKTKELTLMATDADGAVISTVKKIKLTGSYYPSPIWEEFTKEEKAYVNKLKQDQAKQTNLNSNSADPGVGPKTRIVIKGGVSVTEYWCRDCKKGKGAWVTHHGIEHPTNKVHKNPPRIAVPTAS
jgi:hypothetical protein